MNQCEKFCTCVARRQLLSLLASFHPDGWMDSGHSIFSAAYFRVTRSFQMENENTIEPEIWLCRAGRDLCRDELVRKCSRVPLSKLILTIQMYTTLLCPIFNSPQAFIFTHSNKAKATICCVKGVVQVSSSPGSPNRPQPSIVIMRRTFYQFRYEM